MKLWPWFVAVALCLVAGAVDVRHAVLGIGVLIAREILR
jgi:hypothetical protein